MSGLKDSAYGIASSGVFPALSSERLFAIEHVAAMLDRQQTQLPEPWAELIERVREEGVDILSDSDLRRALDRIWTDRTATALAAPLVAAAIARQRRSLDRALIHAYLSRYPTGHRAFETLREAAARAADRHDWRWRDRGRQFGLWEPDAATLALKLGAGMDRTMLLDQAGLTGTLAEGAFAALLAR